MRHQHSVPAVLIVATMALSACDPTALPVPVADSSDAPATAPAGSPKPRTTSPSPHTKPTHPSKKPTTSTTTTTAAGPRVVSFRIKQKPKCAEGTAVFRAKPVPLLIEWTIKGATGGALSVDDHSGTPGTYGEVGLTGTEEFFFTCAGPVGSSETHRYDIYTVGGDGEQRHKTLEVSAKVLDKGPNSPG